MGLRSLGLRAAYVAARASGVLARHESAMRSVVTILTYHRVLGDGDARAYPLPALAMPRTAFAAQLDWLSKRAAVRTLSRALDELRGATPRSDRPTVCITFDDGYADNAEIAAPELEQRGMRATFFLASGFVGRAQLMWFDRIALAWSTPGAARARVLDAVRSLDAGARASESWSASRVLAVFKSLDPETRRRLVATVGTPGEPPATHRPMTPRQAAALAMSGHELGAHSVTHELLPQLDDARLQSELVLSKREVESWSGKPVGCFCYPNGDHDDRVVEAVRRAGFRYACTTRPGVSTTESDPLRLARRDVTSGRVGARGTGGGCSIVSFRAEISGLAERTRGGA
ncbi:MAG: polysaccharide deacetylase family protein [Phycisphaerae bacterium]|nr:polysaccharide deacetylase family protein [Phycisphaerae bacterium]